MNKLKLASLTLLLAGATALPVMAQSAGGEQARQNGRGNGDLDKGPAQSDERDDRREGRGEGGEGRREDRGEGRGENRGDRQDWQASDRGNRGDDNRRNDNRTYEYRSNDNRGYENRGNVNRGDNGTRYAIRGNDHRGYDNRDDGRRYETRGYDGRGYDSRSYDRRDHNRYERHNDRRWNGNQWYPQYRYRAPVRYVYPRGYRAYQWRVGHRLPPTYYHSNYYVDYNAYRLPPPPYGYHWVRVDRDVVLVAIASGLIRDILYGLYY